MMPLVEFKESCQAATSFGPRRYYFTWTEIGEKHDFAATISQIFWDDSFPSYSASRLQWTRREMLQEEKETDRYYGIYISVEGSLRIAEHSPFP